MLLKPPHPAHPHPPFVRQSASAGFIDLPAMTQRRAETMTYVVAPRGVPAAAAAHSHSGKRRKTIKSGDVGGIFPIAAEAVDWR